MTRCIDALVSSVASRHHLPERLGKLVVMSGEQAVADVRPALALVQVQRSTTSASSASIAVPGVPGLTVPARLLTIEDAAQVLSIPATTLAKMVTARQVPHTKVGKHIRFTPGHIAAIITGGEREALVPTQRQRERGSARSRL